MRREQTEGEPIMPKLKTHSASKKRLNLRAGGYVDKTLSATVRKMIPYK